METSEYDIAAALAYRKKRFAVEIKPAKYPMEEGEINLSTTTNGTQWTTISLLRGEIDLVIKALREASE